jgi:hypothetical protein
MTSLPGARQQFNFILIIDATINFILGILLMFFPLDLLTFLGLPITYEPFYANILGAVLIGIAIALLIECKREPIAIGGLGLGGSIAINICGACVIMLWLMSGRLTIPLQGYLVLWIFVFVLLIISGIEMILCEGSVAKKNRAGQEEDAIGISGINGGKK